LKSAPKTRRPRDRDSLGLLRAAARAEFAEHGYAGARVDRIAKRAGVNKQLVFYYFGSKQELYHATVAEITKDTTSSAGPKARPRHPSEDLRETFGNLFDSFSKRADLARLLVTEIQKSGAAQGAYGQTVTRFMSEIRRVVVEGQRHGYFRDDVDPERVAQQALVLALGYVALERVLDPVPDTAKARTWRDSTSELLVRALTW
jgi:AcrR family transcriptional regulator